MPHYYSEKQTSPLNLTKINLKVGNEFFPMYSGSGVFSKKKLDKGTELLAKNLLIQPVWDVLDLGCGIGIVGIYAKKMFPSINLFMSDVNERAVFLARKNAKLNQVEAKVRQSDGFNKISEEFDAVIFNPPQVAGKEVCFRLIEESFKHLKKGGILEIVARHNKGGKTLSEKMNSLFDNVKDVAKGSGYRVYVSQKN
ncbi:MAG: methyltransferase [Nanoarchaeota archaeon]|nr:methyltransferase [Nanoarchaeota archaeon]MBU1269206.1 methyltransferase [Nanoarchaeota archaeon]MBU1605033.1 methyltransferase [Nanoarchaeota archaeon]MBU2443585.1 methyltransferase [Nanoarchaeota archaeon]